LDQLAFCTEPVVEEQPTAVMPNTSATPSIPLRTHVLFFIKASILDIRLTPAGKMYTAARQGGLFHKPQRGGEYRGK
jgi:hypothetical protein